MEAPQLKCCRKISSFSPLFQKSNKLVNLIFFIFRVQFSIIRQKKSNAETVRHSSKSRRTRSDVLEKVQEGRGIQRIHRPSRVSITRWWSHQKALENMCFASSEDLFNCLLYTLQRCQFSNESGETVFDADAFDNKFTSFETRMAACVFRKIFAITDPTSNILQSELIPICTF